MVYAQLRNIQENETHKILWHFKIQTDNQIVKKKKRTCRKVDFNVLADHWWNLKKARREISTYTLLENWYRKYQL